jgi:hypothetical protein
MENLSEELGREREGAKVFEHFCYQDMIQWMDVDDGQGLK